MKVLSDLSVIVPIGPIDQAWFRLAEDLLSLPPEAEVVFVASHPIEEIDKNHLSKLEKAVNFRWILSPVGRGKQLNIGVSSSSKTFLWFLHADTRLERYSLSKLSNSLEFHPNGLHYFDLAFLNDGPWLVKLNAYGTWIRSHLFGLPFGDQGFCLKRSIFKKIGPFRENIPYGEDHLLAWKAKEAGVRLHCTHVKIWTSARKYQRKGWMKTTLEHQFLTFKQALPELLRIITKQNR